MATRYTKAAGKQVNPVYASAQSAIQGQIPATEQLYAALTGGLEDQAAQGTEEILESAGRRGVMRARLGDDVGATLEATLELERARAMAQKAGDLAGIAGNVTEAGVGRVQSVQGMAERLQEVALTNAAHRLAMKELRKKYDLDILDLERGAELDRLRAEIERARAASYGGGGGGGGGATTNTAGGKYPGDIQNSVMLTPDGPLAFGDYTTNKPVNVKKTKKGYRVVAPRGGLSY